MARRVDTDCLPNFQRLANIHAMRTKISKTDNSLSFGDSRYSRLDELIWAQIIYRCVGIDTTHYLICVCDSSTSTLLSLIYPI